MRSGSPRSGRATEGGFTYLGVLFLVVLMGAALAGAGQLWSTVSLRAKERELLWVGNQYAQALRRYYEASQGAKRYPRELVELVEDNRFPKPQRHLRRLYPDPMTGKADWELILAADGSIVGVHSQSSRTVMKTARFPPELTDFEQRTRYDEWEFVADRSFLLGGTGDLPEPGSAVAPPPSAPGSPLVPLGAAPMRAQPSGR